MVAALELAGRTKFVCKENLVSPDCKSGFPTRKEKLGEKQRV